jgi:hypothetical protein
MEVDIGALPIARNTALLSAAHASHSAMLQLSVAVVSITLADVIEVEHLIGLGPAIVIATEALIAARQHEMRRHRRPPLRSDELTSLR